MNIADGRGLKFELIISIFTLWIKSLLGSKLLEDQLHSRVWSLNPSSLSAHFGSSVYLDLNSSRINCSTLAKPTSQGENQSTVRRQQQHQIPNMLFFLQKFGILNWLFQRCKKRGSTAAVLQNSVVISSIPLAKKPEAEPSHNTIQEQNQHFFYLYHYQQICFLPHSQSSSSPTGMDVPSCPGMRI